MGQRVRTFLASLLISLAASPSAAVGLALSNPVHVSLSVSPTAVEPGGSVSISASAWSSDPSLRVELTVLVQGPGFSRTLHSGGASWSGTWTPPARGSYTVWALAEGRDSSGSLAGSATAYATVVVTDQAGGGSGAVETGSSDVSGGSTGSGGLLGKIEGLAKSAWSKVKGALSQAKEAVEGALSSLGEVLGEYADALVDGVGWLVGEVRGALSEVGEAISGALDYLSGRTRGLVEEALSMAAGAYYDAVSALSDAASEADSPAATFVLSAAEAIVGAPGGTALGFAVGSEGWYQITARVAEVLSGLDAWLASWAEENLPEPLADLVEFGAALDSSMRAGAACQLAGLLEAANFLSFGFLDAVRDALAGAGAEEGRGLGEALKEELCTQTFPGQILGLLEEAVGPGRSWRERARAAGTLTGLALLAAATAGRRDSRLESNPEARALLEEIRAELGGRKAGAIKRRAVEVAELFGEEDAIRYLRGDANFVRLLVKKRKVGDRIVERIYLKLSSDEIKRLGLKSEEYANLVFRTADGRTFELSLKVPKAMSNGKMEVALPYFSELHPELGEQLVEIEVRPPRDVGWLMQVTDDRGYRKLKVSPEYVRMKASLGDELAPDQLVRVEVDGRKYYAILRRSGDDLTLTLPRDVTAEHHVIRIERAGLEEVFPSEPVPGLKLEYAGDTLSIRVAAGAGGGPLTLAEGVRPELDPYTGELRLLFSVDGVEFALEADGDVRVRVSKRWVEVERVRVAGSEASIVTGLGEISLGRGVRAVLSTVEGDLTLSGPIAVPDEILESPEIQAGISEYVNSLKGGEEGTFQAELGKLGEKVTKKYFELRGFEFEKHGKPTSPVDGFVIENGIRIPVEVKTSAVDDFSTLIRRAIRGDVRSNGEVRGGALYKYFRSHPEVPYGYAVAVKYESGRLLILIRKVVNPFRRTASARPPTRPPGRTYLPGRIPR
ncbi:MAG: hypothetical protein QI223_10570 [Candidatus Korarchaeota archaeon]|nr:hypothetical protein [Candidatus Korarchaeota archaeon]